MMVSLEFLSLSNNVITNLDGVGKCENLIELNINFNNLKDITPL